MDFAESIAALADHAQKIRNDITTEEATKTALVMPFIQALGYNVFNPLEVVTVGELKANRLIKERLAKNLETPQEGFVSYFITESQQVKKPQPKCGNNILATSSGLLQNSLRNRWTAS